jgi:uncharacterized membrane protein YgcG
MKKKSRTLSRRARIYLIWAWPVYLVFGVALAALIYRISGTAAPPPWGAPFQGDDPRRDTLAFTFIFGVLGTVLAKVFVDPVLAGLADRRSKAELARELITDVAKTGAEFVAETVLDGVVDAAGSAASGGDGSTGSFGGGSSGGGGASGSV